MRLEEIQTKFNFNSITSLRMRFKTVSCCKGDVKFKAGKHNNQTPQTPLIYYLPIL